jgi:organic hydroperoxide reductase OsmC/OhrA
VLHDGADGSTFARWHHADAHPHRREGETGEVGEAFSITSVELETEADITDIDDAAFQKYALDAKQSCPVWKALAGTEIRLNAKLL